MTEGITERRRCASQYVGFEHLVIHLGENKGNWIVHTLITFWWVRHLNVCVCGHVDNVEKYFYDNRVEKDLSRHKIPTIEENIWLSLIAEKLRMTIYQKT